MTNISSRQADYDDFIRDREELFKPIFLEIDTTTTPYADEVEGDYSGQDAWIGVVMKDVREPFNSELKQMLGVYRFQKGRGNIWWKNWGNDGNLTIQLKPFMISIESMPEVSNVLLQHPVGDRSHFQLRIEMNPPE